MFVEEEDRYVCDIDEFVDLRPAGAVFGAGVAVGRCLADAVGLVADQCAEAVLLGRHEAVEVLEEILHLTSPGSRHLPHRLSEGLRTGRVQGRNTPAVQLAEQLQSDDALARARTAGDDHDLLVVGLLRPPYRVEHETVGDLLFVEEDELLAFADLLGGDGHQLSGGHRRRAEKFVGGVCAGVPVAEPGAEVVEELAPALPGEQLPVVVALDLAQPGHAELGGVVEEGHAADTLRATAQRSVEVDEVLAVPTYLLDGVQDGVGVGVDVAERGVVLVRLRLAPLLEFDDHVRRVPRARMYSGEDRVGALAVERQRVLEHDLHVPETGVVQRGGQTGMLRSQERTSEVPGRYPCRWTNRSVRCRNSELSSALTATDFADARNNKDFPQAARNDSCGWGHVLRDPTEVERKPVGPR